MNSKETERFKRKAPRDFGRHSAIEPFIEHLKNDFRLARNYQERMKESAQYEALVNMLFKGRLCIKINVPYYFPYCIR